MESSSVNDKTNRKCKIKCMVCPGWCYSEPNVRICDWCSKTVHKKCHRDNLGCIKCCESNIPGYHAEAHELLGKSHQSKFARLNFNPYDRSHIINSIGNTLDPDGDLNNEFCDHTSEILTNCKYQKFSNITPSSSTELKVFSLNIRSLAKSVEYLREEIDTFSKFDILCFSETNCNIEKLPNGITDIVIDGFYEPYLKAPARVSGRGGGLAIYVNKNLSDPEKLDNFDLDLDLEDKSGEFQFLKIHDCKNSNKTKVIVNFYRSPSRDPNKFLDLLGAVLSGLDRHSRKHISFYGDANIDLIKYDTDIFSQRLIDTLANYGFVQTVSKPTRITDRSATLIDHVYTNNIENTVSSNIITLDLSDHLATITTIKLSTRPHNRSETRHGSRRSNETRVINEANNLVFKELLEGEQWEGVLETDNACERYEKFLEIYTSHYNTAYPLRRNRIRREHERIDPKPWILPWLETACARKQLSYHTKITAPTDENVAAYDKLKKFCDKHVNRAKNQYYKKQFEKHQDNSKKQWKIINGLLNRNRKGTDRIRLKDTDGTILSTDQAVAEKFNGYFSNIAAKIKSQIATRQTFDPGGFQDFLHDSCSESLYLKPADPSEIQKTILCLKNKATLDSKIEPLKVASSCQNFLAVLSEVVNASFTEGVFPKALKIAKVIPIYKGGSKQDVSNYRPISLLSSFSKIYEKLVHSRVLEFLDKHNSLFENQYGFRPGRSCEHALLNAQSTILHSLSKNQVALLLLLDYSKAFDVLDHRTLLRKLEHYGFRGIALKWFESYLKGRSQFVALNSTESSSSTIMHGVPQGSILGPLLFVIYINDLPGISNIAKFILYADDANIIITGYNAQEIIAQIGHLTTTLMKWVNCNGLALNLKKTCYMVFSRKRIDTSTLQVKIDNSIIEQKTEARFLGVIVDENLTWASHIRAVRIKMSRFIGVMHKIKNRLPIKARLQIFQSFVQSHLNFCSLVWGFAAKSHIESLFARQKQGIRAIMPGYVNFRYKDGKPPDHTKQAFKEYEILTVHGVIIKNALILMHKLKSMPHLLPRSIKELFPDNIPKFGSSYEENAEWLSIYSGLNLRPSIFYKGPILAITEQNVLITCPSSIFSLSIYKKSAKRVLLNLQSDGISEEWPTFLLNNLPGLRKSARLNTQQSTRNYSENDNTNLSH